MKFFMEDGPRNSNGLWTVELVELGLLEGLSLSPFTTPYVGNGYKPSGIKIAEQVRTGGGVVWFDAMTHALDFPSVGDFRYYDGWDLWGAVRSPDLGSSLSTAAIRRDHIARVFDAQDQLGAPHLCPTRLVQSPVGSRASSALELAVDGLRIDSGCWIHLAGTEEFWASGAQLDAFVARLVEAGPSGFVLTVARSTDVLPVAASPADVSGLLRTVHTLSAYAPVRVSHGDLAAIGCAAVGATAVGTGLDVRQRAFFPAAFDKRDPSPGGGGWPKRPTFSGLLGLLTRSEAEAFFASNSALARSLHVGNLHVDAPKELLTHHVRQLVQLAAIAAVPRALAVSTLGTLYRDAAANWPLAQSASNSRIGADRWIVPFLDGLVAYAVDEGFTA